MVILRSELKINALKEAAEKTAVIYKQRRHAQLGGKAFGIDGEFFARAMETVKRKGALDDDAPGGLRPTRRSQRPQIACQLSSSSTFSPVMSSEENTLARFPIYILSFSFYLLAISFKSRGHERYHLRFVPTKGGEAMRVLQM